MKIATWNVNECVGITCDLDKVETVDAINRNNINEIIDKINEYDFDVICFQEFPVKIDDKEELIDRIKTETKLKYYVFKDTYDSYLFNGGRVGVCIFSKYEIQDKHITLFNNPHLIKVSSNGNTYESFDKAIIMVKIKVDEKYYNVIGGHAIAFAPFGKTEWEYPSSYKPLEDLIDKNSNDNLIVLGDFNCEKLFALIPSIETEVVDVINGPTTKEWYEKRGEVQMDYIMISNNLDSTDVKKIDNFSDHYIVCAEIK